MDCMASASPSAVHSEASTAVLISSSWWVGHSAEGMHHGRAVRLEMHLGRTEPCDSRWIG